jgi:hypothetical protein
MREISKLPPNAAPLISADTTYRIGIGLGWNGGQKGGAEHVRAV